MYLLKQCPRCKIGDLGVQADQYGKRLVCLQCAHDVLLTRDGQVEIAIPNPHIRTNVGPDKQKRMLVPHWGKKVGYPGRHQHK